MTAGVDVGAPRTGPVAVRRGAPLALVAVAASVLLWSTTYGLGAIVLRTASPAVLAELRLGLALPVLVGLVAFTRAPGRSLTALAAALRRPRTVLYALIGVALFYLPSNIGLSLSTAGTAALVSATLPVLTAVLAVLILRERVSLRVGLGLVLTTLGVGVATAQDGARFGVGAVLLAVGLVSYALYTVLLRRQTVRAVAGSDAPPDSFVLAAATAAWGAVLLLPWLGWEALAGAASLPATAEGWWSAGVLAVAVTGPSMALFNYGAERVPAAVSGAATAIVPVFAYLFAIALGEPLEAVRLLGGAVALVGIVVATLPDRGSSPPVQAHPPSTSVRNSD